MRNLFRSLCAIVITLFACGKDDNPPPPPPPVTPPSFTLSSLTVNGSFAGFTYYNTNYSPVIRLSFSTKINPDSVNNAISFRLNTGGAVSFTRSMENGDSTVVIRPSSPLTPLNQYVLDLGTNLKSQQNGNLQSGL